MQLLTGEPNPWRHPVKHYRWMQTNLLEWCEIMLVPRWAYTLRMWIKNPRGEFSRWKFYHSRPKVGGFLLYHDEGPYRVVARDGDDMTVETPTGRQTVSWLNCCYPAPKP